MKKIIIRLRLEAFRNEVHVEFHKTFCTVVAKHSPTDLDLGAIYDAYQHKYVEELVALDVIRKSELTGEIVEQDHLRDRLYRGLSNSVKAACDHFNVDKRAAAHRLEIVFERYGNIAAKTLDQESAAIDDLIRELNDTYLSDVAMLMLGEWVASLAAANQQFETLMQARYSESSQRPNIRMRDARMQVDSLYRMLTERLEALVEINGLDDYAALVNEANAVIERYKNIFASEAGRRHARNDNAKSD